jgi:hypothetical protein
MLAGDLREHVEWADGSGQLGRLDAGAEEKESRIGPLDR